MTGGGSGSSPPEQQQQHPGSQEALVAMANGDPSSHVMLGNDRNRNLLNKKMASSSSSYEAFGSPSFSPPGVEEGVVVGHPIEEIPLAPTGEYKPSSCGTLTRREVYL